MAAAARDFFRLDYAPLNYQITRSSVFGDDLIYTGTRPVAVSRHADVSRDLGANCSTLIP